MRIKVVPPDYFLIFILLNIVLDYLIPIKEIIFYPYKYFGILFIILGIYLNLKVYFVYKKVKNPMKPDEIPNVLITSSVFKITRNPIYLGMFLILLGEAIFLGSLISFTLPIVFIILVDRITIPAEEKILEKRFGKKYLNYKNIVRRWI